MIIWTRYYWVMKQRPRRHILDLIERIARINAADEWSGGLNPTQWTALSYLARANRFSRAPSQVTEFMAATRGTVSQTLKALARKGLIEEIRSETDRRWISYVVTEAGAATLDRSTLAEDALKGLDPSQVDPLADGLEAFLRGALKARGGRPFGLCKTCRHHKSRRTGGYCTLLDEDLAPEETRQICYEHEDAA